MMICGGDNPEDLYRTCSGGDLGTLTSAINGMAKEWELLGPVQMSTAPTRGVTYVATLGRLFSPVTRPHSQEEVPARVSWKV